MSLDKINLKFSTKACVAWYTSPKHQEKREDIVSTSECIGL